MMKPYSLQNHVLLMLLMVMALTGCKTTRQSGSSLPQEVSYLSSKVKLTVPHRDAVLTVNGTMKLKAGECMQLSFLMPIFRSEVARMEVTPDEILLVDRMGKRYVKVTRKELKNVLPKKADFANLEKILYEASKPNGKKILVATDLGIPSLEKGQIELFNFSDKEFVLSPTELSAKYRKVELSELMELLAGIQKGL